MNSATTTMVVPRESHPDARLGPAPGFLEVLLRGVAHGPRWATPAITCLLALTPQHRRRAPRQIRPDRRCLHLHKPVHLAVFLVLAATQPPAHDDRIAHPQRRHDAIGQAAPTDHAEEQLRPVDPGLLTAVEPTLRARQPE